MCEFQRDPLKLWWRAPLEGSGCVLSMIRDCQTLDQRLITPSISAYCAAGSAPVYGCTWLQERMGNVGLAGLIITI